MTRAENLRRNNNSIAEMENKILHKNPHLGRIMRRATVLPSFPVVISQISFSAKSTIENGALMLGDSAGMITPLCGNGMSIALHTGKIAATLGDAFLKGRLSRPMLETEYNRQWQTHFSKRVGAGRLLQRFFGSSWLSNGFVTVFRWAPFLATPVIRRTHGKPF